MTLALASRPLPRRLAAAAVALAYALPLAVSALASASHGAFHAMERLEARKAEAAALGLVHTAERSSFTHTHGGSTHSHAGAVDALLVAAEDTDEGSGALVPIIELAAHTPATVLEMLVGPSTSRVVKLLHPIVPSHPRALPPVPPPRA